MSLGFPVLSCPKEIRDVADDFKDLLGSSYTAFVAVLCGAIFGISGFNNIVRFLMFSPCVSALSRFFNDPELYKKLNHRQRRRLLSILSRINKNPNRYLWVFDDTLVAHEGEKIWGTYWWHDHNTQGSVHGHKLLVLGIVDRDKKLLIPVFWEILHQEVEGHEDQHEKGGQVALKLLDAAIEFGFPKLTVCADSWFACEEFFEALSHPDRKMRFVLEIRCNRKVIGNGRAKNLNVSVDEFFSKRTRNVIFYRRMKKWAAEAVLRFKNSKQSLKTIAVANKKGLAHEAFAFYVSNQLTWNASQIWAIARDRWAIEVQFRDLKQIFTLGGAAVRSKQAVETSISVSAIALTVIRLEQIARADANENQHTRPIPAGGIVNEFTLLSLKRSISKLASPNPTKIKQKVAARMCLKNFGTKPTEELQPTRNQARPVNSRKAA
jgi:hypothetical protein